MPQGGRTRRRLLIAIPALAATAALITGVVMLAPSSTPLGSASAEAATLLNAAADHIRATDPAAAPGQWWKVTTTGFDLATGGNKSAAADIGAVLVSSDYTQYISVDGSHDTYMVSGPSRVVKVLAGSPETVKLLTPQGRDRIRVTTTDLAPSGNTGWWQVPNAVFLDELPRDVVALHDRLYADVEGHGQSTDGEAFVYVVDLLHSGLVPADLRAALYRVLATIPGIEITERKAGIGTQSGVAFGFLEGADGERSEIVINPVNGEFIGERTVTVHGFAHVPAGTVTEEKSVTRSLVDAVPQSVLDQAKVKHCEQNADSGAIMCTN